MALKPITVAGGGDPYNSEKVNFERPGDNISGHLVESVKLSKDGSTFMKYVLLTEDGHKSFLGSYQLDKAMAVVPPRSLVQITYQGKKKVRGGKTMREFEVLNDPNDLAA